jgi:hemolysin activation/secretion protein
MILSPKVCLKRSFIGDTVLLETGLLAAPETLFNLEGEDPIFMPTAEITGAFHFARFNSLNLKVSSGWAQDDLPFLNAFNLYDTEDRSIRSGYSYHELNGESFFLINFEYRFTFPRIFIPPFFDTGIQLFIFSDIGWVEEHGEGMFSGVMKDAYGGGLRLLFENPVFAYFTFAYGVNRRGRGRFVFTGTAGF